MKRLLAHFVSLHLVFETSQSNVRPSLARAYVPNRPVAIGSGLLWILICVHRLNWISMYSWMTPGAPLALTAHRLSIRPEKGLLIPEFSANSNLRHYNPSSAGTLLLKKNKSTTSRPYHPTHPSWFCQCITKTSLI